MTRARKQTPGDNIAGFTLHSDMKNLRQIDPSRLELGAATMGGFGLGHVPTLENAVDLVRTATDAGIRRFDSAALYGHFSAEEFLGNAFDALGIDRKEINLNTKVGRAIVPKVGRFTSSQPPLWSLPSPHCLGIDTWDLSYVGIMTSFYGSMTRLRIEAMDVALHDPIEAVNETPGMDYSLFDDAIRALEDLKQEGFATGIGIGGKSIEEMVAMVGRYGSIFDFIVATTYNMMHHREAQQVLIPLCKENNIELRVAGPYTAGILAIPNPTDPATPKRDVYCNYRLATDEEIERVGRMWDVATAHGEPNLRRLALWFVALNPDVDRIILGASNVEQLEETLSYLDQPPGAEIWSALKEGGLIDRDAPTG